MTRKVDVVAPAPMQKIHDAAIAFHGEDFDIRIRATGRKPPTEAFNVREIAEAGIVFEDDLIKVTATLVNHPPFKHAFAFRIDTADRSIVLSGDTTPCETLITLAQGADLLVHEAMYEPGIDAMLAQRPYVPPELRAFLLAGHTSAEDCGRIATKAGVNTIALTHLLPSDERLVSEQVWRQEVARHYNGNIVIGRDLMIL
jgi:ribonuclease BN (tRNA processing enzyme)